MRMTYRRLVEALKRTLGRRSPPARSGKPDPGAPAILVRAILSTREDEIDCDRCFEELDRFVELELDGTDAAAALPLVQDHLARCPDCREEHEALLAALRP